MTTLEKLLVQIYERKNAIIEQVRQQAELYNQHLASKLVIDGITPPSWLLTPNSSLSKELNKEEIISKLLRPYPQPSARCSVAYYPLYNNPVLTGDNVEFSDGTFMENMSFSEGLNRQEEATVPDTNSADHPGCALDTVPETDASVTSPEVQTEETMVPATNSVDHLGCALNTIPETDASVTSPEDQTEERILYSNNAHGGSLAGIQRSKSRQKALELRSSAKALAKSGLNQTNITDGFSNQIRFSLPPTNQAGQTDEVPILTEPFVIGGSCEDMSSDEHGCQNEGQGMDPGFVRDSIASGCSSEDCREGASSTVSKARKRGASYISDSEQADDNVNKLPKSAGQYTICCQSCGARILDGEDDLRKGSRIGVYSKRGCCACDSSKPDSSDDCQRVEISMMDTGNNRTPECVDRSLVEVTSANVLNEVCEARESISGDCKIHRKMSDVACIDRSLARVSPANVGNEVNEARESTSEDCRSHKKMSDVACTDRSLARVSPANVSNEVNEARKSTSVDYRSHREKSDVACTDRPLARVSPANFGNEFNEARESTSEDYRSQRKKSDAASWRSSKHNACVDEPFDLDIHSHSAKVGGSSPSHGRSAVQVNGSNEVQGLVKSAAGLSWRMTRSQTRSDVKETSEPSKGSTEVQGLVKAAPGLSCRMTRSQTGSDVKETSEPLKGSNEVHGLVKSAPGMSRRMTRSQTRSDVKETSEPLKRSEYYSFGVALSKSGSKQKPYANDELQNASGSELIIPCYGTQDMLDEPGNSGFVMAAEHVLHDHVDQSGSSSSSDDKSIELEPQPALAPIESLVFVELKELNFNGLEGDNLRTSTLTSGKGGLDKSPKMISRSSPNPVVSVDKGFCGDTDLLSLSKQLPEKSDLYCKVGEVLEHSNESAVQENPDSGAGIRGPVICELLKTFEDYTGARLTSKSSEVQEADILQSEMTDIPDAQVHPVKLHLGNVHELLSDPHIEEVPELQTEQGNRSGEVEDKNQLMSELENMRFSHCLNYVNDPRPELRNCLIENVERTNPTSPDPDNILQFPAQESQFLSCLEGEVSVQHSDSPLGDNGAICSAVGSLHDQTFSTERRFRIASMESWPQLKRRKIEHEQVRSCTASPSFRARNAYSIQGIQSGPGNTYLEKRTINADTILMDTFDLNESTDIEIRQEMDPKLTEGTESPFAGKNGEVGFCSKQKNERQSSSPVITDEQLLEALVTSLPNKEAKTSQGCFLEGMRTPNLSSKFFDASEPNDGQCNQHLCIVEKNTDHQNSENAALTNTALQQIQSSKQEIGLHAQLSPSNRDLEFLDVDQSMPVFEGFIVDAQENNGELDLSAEEIDLNRFELSTNTIERASILAEICRSASLNTPLSHFSSTFDYQKTQTVFHSLPNGLESLDLRSSTLPSNSDVGKQLQSGKSLANNYKNAFEGMPYSDCLPYSGARYGWNARNQHTSPVGKLWERLSSNSGSSEKRLSTNPELTCFPIEEDPSVSEENKNADDNADDVEDEISSSLAKQDRQPLKELIDSGLNNLPSVSVQDETWKADSLEFVSTKFSIAGTQKKAQRSPKNQYRDKRVTRGNHNSSFGASDGRRNQTLSIGTNVIKKAKESYNSSVSRTISKKTSLKRQDQKLSLKESVRNNIVSNVSSFIPLVHQKQAAAAAACAGKRDAVKVKALKAAEAAKRLEEKKENDRRIRKEAMELERAKLEEENLRNMELEKKKKEEERKKKDADIIAKKRLREEEERKDREKKRMKLETRQQKREQEEKMRAYKAGQQKLRSKDEQINRIKELHIDSKKQQNTDAIRIADVALQKAEMKSTPSNGVMNYEECGISGQSFEAGKAMLTEDKSPSNQDMIQKNPGKSYEISPYQCSDDEDEEDAELSTKKSVPSWASKHAVALLIPLQEKMDPDTIFPSESFCNMDEVLLPRKLQQKQVAR